MCSKMREVIRKVSVTDIMLRSNSYTWVFESNAYSFVRGGKSLVNIFRNLVWVQYLLVCMS